MQFCLICSFPGVLYSDLKTHKTVMKHINTLLHCSLVGYVAYTLSNSHYYAFSTGASNTEQAIIVSSACPRAKVMVFELPYLRTNENGAMHNITDVEYTILSMS